MVCCRKLSTNQVGKHVLQEVETKSVLSDIYGLSPKVVHEPGWQAIVILDLVKGGKTIIAGRLVACAYCTVLPSTGF